MSEGLLDTIRTYVTPTKSEKQRKINKESEQITEAWRAELLALEDAINKRINKKKKAKRTVEISTLVAFGEIFTGFVYILVGLCFFNQVRLSDWSKYGFRVGVALTFLVGGLEELCDAFFEEGENTAAVLIQVYCTAAQFITACLAIFFIWRAKLLTVDFAGDSQ